MENFPLRVIPGEEQGPEIMHIPFSVSELKENTKDLGSYTEILDHYIHFLTDLYVYTSIHQLLGI
jgi:hypothetical protein